jgi:hypothetical protein
MLVFLGVENTTWDYLVIALYRKFCRQVAYIHEKPKFNEKPEKPYVVV